MSILHRSTARFAAVARGFLANTRGTTAIVTAVGGTAFIGFAALAVDVGVVEFQRQNVQRAVDSALLTAIATQKYNPNDLAPMKAAIESHLAKTLSADQAANVSVTLAPKEVGDEKALEVTATMSWSWSSAGLLGGSGGNMTVTSLAFEQSKPIELALVLDTTGSMAGAKMTALKTAASDLVDMLLPDGTESKIAVVPFSEYVNIGTGYRGASWLEIPADVNVTRNECTTKRDVISETNCRLEPAQSTSCQDGVCTTTTFTNRVCDLTYGPPYQQCGPQTITQTWTGCVGSRSYPLNVRDVLLYGTSAAGKYPGMLTGVSCPSRVTTLTDNRQVVKSAISALTPVGETYIPAGLMWGLNVLSQNEPISDAVPYTETETPKIMVLMTDGINTKSLNYVWYLPTSLRGHTGGVSSEPDLHMSELCENIKAENIELYTVALQVTNSSMITRLRNCATSPDHAFTADNASQLGTVFGEIGLSLRKLSLGH